MSWLLLLAQVAAPAAPATLGATKESVDVPMALPRGAPSYRDEFAGARLDTARWRYDTELNRRGWANNELQYYSAYRPENARVADGVLTIEARQETLSDRPDWGGQDWSSARLVSREPLGYGFYEVRAKLPCARGGWPAIWLLPTGGKWPDQGEIDIMETVGWDPNVIHGTLHSGSYNHRLGTQRGAQRRLPTACTRFHRYQLDWSPTAITVGIDGRGFMRVANDRPGDRGAWPFTRPFHLILNLAVGGDWGGKQGVDAAAFPQAMQVDYVRYWRRP